LQASKSLVVFLFLSVFFFGITNGGTLTSAANTSIAKDFSASAGQMATLFTFYFLAFVVIAPLCGYLAERFGRKNLIVAGGTVLAIGLLIFGFSIRLGFVFGQIGQFLMGSGGIILQVVATSTISDIYRANPARALNLSQVFFGIGAFVAPILAGYLLDPNKVALPWPTVYFASTVLIVLLALGLMAVTFPAPEAAAAPTGEPAAAKGGAGSLFLSGSFLALVLVMLAYGCAEMATSTGIPQYLENGLHATKAAASSPVSFYWGLMTVGRLIGAAAMPPKVSYPAVMFWSTIAGGICLALANQLGSIPLALVLFPLMGFSIAIIWPTILADARRRVKEHSAAAFGIIIGAGGLGAMLYPLVVGRIADAVKAATEDVTRAWALAMNSILLPVAVMALVFAIFYAVDKGRRGKD